MQKSPVNENVFPPKMIENILARVKDDLELIKEGPIFFLVMNGGKDNLFDDALIAKMSKLLDIVNASEGAACMITIATSERRFSTGFNLDYWL
jgi:enoyl-CoA hydratase/carnithine racemase